MMKAAVTLLVLLSLAGCISLRQTYSEAEITAPVHDFVRALTYADVDALERSFAAEATVFMPFDELPRRIEGTAAIRDAFAPYFEDLRASDREPPYFSLEARDLSVQRLSDGIAIVSFHLGELPQAEGSEPVRFSRRTFVVKRGAEGWKIAHLHASNMTLSPRRGT